MIRDSFYYQILQKLDELQGAEDGDPFERCACDLLRKLYPTLVPISGGNDSGRDGSISYNGLQIFLVCTVSKPVITNVKNSLGSYIKGNGKGRDIVVATPRALTAKQRNNLE